MKEIVVMAPIPDVYEKTREIIRSYGYHNVDVILGTMSEGVEIARKLEKEGVKILVTRGGTYKLAKAALKIPVVEIKVSAYDLIESFDKITDPKETVGLVGYSNVVVGYDVMKKLILNHVEFVTLSSEKEIPEIISQYKDRGISTFIGDSNVTKVVEGLQCRGILIHSQKESILIAIQEARRILRAIYTEQHMAEHLKAITDFVRDGIISIDENRNITHINRTAEKILRLPLAESVGRSITEVMGGQKYLEIFSRGKKVIGEIIERGTLTLSLNYIPLYMEEERNGAVITFQEIQEIQKMEYKIRKTLSSKGFLTKYSFADIVHVSKTMEETINTAEKFAVYDAPIHIYGPSGTGKELFAQSIHNESGNSKGPFVAVNCAAIPPSLIESEFFGYEEGAFTGARKTGKPGIFELAHNGTLFLDEISEIPMDLQGRLLRVLQEKEVMRVGGEKLIPVKVRIITASNKRLSEMVKEEVFRKDLYYRINVLTLNIPSLSQRREDILPLSHYFIDRYAKLYHKEKPHMDQGTERLIAGLPYEGNIRELENIMERSVILSSFEHLYAEFEDYLPENEEGAKDERRDLRKNAGNDKEKEKEKTDKIRTDGEAEKAPLAERIEAAGEITLSELENLYIRKVYEETDRDIQRTCEILNISRSTLWRKLNQTPHQ